MDAALGMIVYSGLLALALVAGAPWWGWRMLTSGRYREGLGERLGSVPPAFRAAMAGRQVVWLHAVSVGEVLAAARLVAELQQALGQGWVIAVSTTTATGQKIARERLGALGCPVFYFPLDFAFAIRAWLRVLRPRLLVLVESELWPRLLTECERAGVPVAVVNARMSDRSFHRAQRVRSLWMRMAGKVSLWLAQGDETAARLRALGVDRISLTGNLKFDLAQVPSNAVAAWMAELAAGRPVIVAGSTLDRATSGGRSEEETVVQAWEGPLRTHHRALLVLAPRHPERFTEVEAMASEFSLVKASERLRKSGASDDPAEVVLLDTLGDLAAVYSVANVALIGGSFVPRGGHNPLEAARFGVPILMGPSCENFREIVDGMRAAHAIRIVPAPELAAALLETLERGQAMGERGRAFYESQAGATGRSVAALLALLPGRAP